MLRKAQKMFIFIILLVVQPLLGHAANNNHPVAIWAANALNQTLSLNYKTLPSNLNKAKKYYMPIAWQTLTNFLNDKLVVIQDRHLILRPKALTYANIFTQEDYAGVRFWRVNQRYRIPELNMDIAFSLIIVKASKQPYLIQSINMTKTEPTSDNF